MVGLNRLIDLEPNATCLECAPYCLGYDAGKRLFEFKPIIGRKRAA